MMLTMTLQQRKKATCLQQDENNNVNKALLTLEEMPNYLQFNRFVLTGYRPMLTTSECIRSLFYWHNETANIYTHAVPAVSMLLLVHFIVPWDHDHLHTLQLLIHAQALISVWTGSVIYHVFMNHKSGRGTYHELLKWDLIGVWMSNAIGSLNPLYVSVYCMDSYIKWTILLAFLASNAFALNRLLKTRDLFERGLCFIPSFCFRGLITYLRYFDNHGGSDEVAYLLILQEFFTVLGLIIGVAQVPERFWPGKFDFIGNSHNILHVFPILGCYFMHCVIVKDFEWLNHVHQGLIPCINKT